jgi:hypothetical protein
MVHVHGSCNKISSLLRLSHNNFASLHPTNLRLSLSLSLSLSRSARATRGRQIHEFCVGIGTCEARDRPTKSKLRRNRYFICDRQTATIFCGTPLLHRKNLRWTDCKF